MKEGAKLIFPLKGIVDVRHPKQGLQDMKEVGYSQLCLDFGMFFNTYELSQNKYNLQQKKKEYAHLINQLSEMQFSVDVAILPDISSEELREDVLDRKVQETNALRQQLEISKWCINACEEIGIRNIIIQLMVSYQDSHEDYIESIREYCMELLKYCHNDCTRLLLYNKCNKVRGSYVRSFLADGDTAVTMINKMNNQVGKKRFGFALDTGSCNLCGQDMNEMVNSLAGHLDIVILRENNGSENFSAIPFTNYSNGLCSTDWLSLIRGLRCMNSNPLLVMDFSTTAANFSPILRPGLLTFAKSIGDYFEWQIGVENALKKYSSIVLFGAGNMCRNFMKCYGSKYRPLFTCDNNSSLWGTEFEGLEVKDPESIKEISDNCGVFICNIYYREIEAQLRQLGVKNIEYFNDEYMQSFYFDRLERKEPQ